MCVSLCVSEREREGSDNNSEVLMRILDCKEGKES